MPIPAMGAHTEADFGPRTSNGECVSGSCNDGFGTIRYPDGTEITGRHVNGRQVSGTYEIRWACQPDTTFPMTYDDSGKYVMGTVIRTCFNDANKLSAPARITSYTGTFTTITNPFTREEISSYKAGSYMDSRGIVWEGEFDYIPVKDSVDLPGYGETLLRSGAFVFIGAKIDPELDEVVRGLFISEPTRPGQEIYLTRARPDYLAKLRSTFVANRNQNAHEIAEDERASRELFSTIATIVTSAAVMYGTYKLAEMSDRSAMDSMTNVIKGVKSPAAANAALPQTQNGSAVKSARPVTVAEYRNLQRDAQATQDARPQAQSQLKAAKESRQLNGEKQRLAANNIDNKLALLNAKEDQSWKTCGATQLCEIGDGYLHFCKGPAIPGANRCKSECRMTSGVSYHDTTLSNNAAYIPSAEPCKPGCTAVNSC